MKTGLESLDTGAPEITYSGNEGPKSPQQMQQMQQMQMAQLEEEYDAYVDDMIEQGIEPMSMRQFLEQIAAEAQMSSNEEGIGSMMEDPREMAADGGIMNNKKIKGQDHMLAYITPNEVEKLKALGGQETMTKEGIPAYPEFDNYGFSSQEDFDSGDVSRSNDPNVRGEGPGQNRVTASQLAATNAAEEKAAKEKAAKEKAAKEKAAKEKEAKETAQTKSFFEKIKEAQTKSRRMTLAKSLNKKLNLGFNPDDDDFLDQIERVGETTFSEPDMNDPFAVDYDMSNYGLTGKNLARGKKQFEVIGQDNISQRDFENVYRPYDQMFVDGEFTPGPIIRTGGGGGGGGQQTQQPATPPATPPPGGGLPDIPTDFVDLSGTQSYTNPAFAGQYFYGTPTITLANGGRANYAGGGIANLRQGYFLGKLVKSITKPFKKAFRGFKKIAKSPMGKMALLALGGYYLGGGTGLGGARMFPGNTGFSMQNLPGASFFSKKPVLSPNAIGGDKVIPKLMSSNNLKPALDSGNFLTKSLGFMKDNPLATIYGTSLFSGLYTDYMNNKRKDETMADYQRRLEEERGNFAPIPVDPVQFAANGGRIGFADGGDDEDEDESIRSKALGALYQKLAMGGSAGLPPVTMQTEGQDTQSFGDDESTGMPQATPTMQNQMPMRQPMMDPRIQNQMMMAQRGNPMMNRGMMSMQQPPRIMAQEGGMMDMGGMEKDYRNEGGFVPIGEYERKDDVPARLSKNEFVFTADAVRNAGGGDIDRGAEIMENMMENLEAGGKISEASQGLKGAREMFATQQRLGEVL
jgi:hypothetical protein